MRVLATLIKSAFFPVVPFLGKTEVSPLLSRAFCLRHMAYFCFASLVDLRLLRLLTRAAQKRMRSRMRLDWLCFAGPD